MFPSPPGSGPTSTAPVFDNEPGCSRGEGIRTGFQQSIIHLFSRAYLGEQPLQNRLFIQLRAVDIDRIHRLNQSPNFAPLVRIVAVLNLLFEAVEIDELT